jgi:hydroxymethylglutaryl-CoA synthase
MEASLENRKCCCDLHSRWALWATRLHSAIRLPATEVSAMWGGGDEGLPIKEKAVPGLDEDTSNLVCRASRNALRRARIEASELRAVVDRVRIAPYAVKPSSTIVAEAIGATPNIQSGDWEFACKAGTEAFTAAMGWWAAAWRVTRWLSARTAQGRPATRWSSPRVQAVQLSSLAWRRSPGSDRSGLFARHRPPVFWRREGQKYPEHGQRFTGEPSYFKHIASAAQVMLEGLGATAADFQWAVFHQPNTKFPQRAAAQLGFSKEQIAPGLLVPVIGNTYAGAALVGLTGILDVAKPGDRILMVSMARALAQTLMPCV